MDGTQTQSGLIVVFLVCVLWLILFTKKKNETPRWHERPHLGLANRMTRGQQVSLDTMRIYDPESYHRTLRFYPEDFDRLLHIVGPFITKDNLRRESINPSTRLGLTLRYLATGESQNSIALSYVVGVQTAREIIWETTWVLWKQLQPLTMPQPTQEMFEEISNGFWIRWNVPNCCGSLDGKLVRIKKPPHSGSDFFCYKDYHATTMLGWCDYRYRFIAVDTGAKGRSSDGGVFMNSTLGKKLKSNTMNLPPPKHVPNGPLLPHFLLGDEAFALSSFLMTPYAGRSSGKLSYTQRIYNYRQSRGRRIIENAFGLHVAVWRILRTEIEASVDLVDQIVMATACLHNFRLMLNDERGNVYVPSGYFDAEVNGTDVPGSWRDNINLDQIAPQSGRHAAAAAVKYRNELAEFFLTAGAVPWQHDMIMK